MGKAKEGPILAPTFLFRFSVPCFRTKEKWNETGITLKEKHTLASFGELEGRPLFADLRIGWNEAGIVFNVRVQGKKQPPWCRATRLDDSDGLTVWIDTRDTHNIHRAGKFCHQFVFLPQGSGRDVDEPTARLIQINRAKESPKSIVQSLLQVRSEKRIDGYVLEAFIPAEAITGFDPSEYSKLGFNYAVKDRELNWQTFTIGPEFPIEEDPSLWGTLELVD
ncbi:MAG: hypothetical protein ACI9G1_004663 [Pirellulaceae bacterium]|jgi:hypothetical protein